MNWVVSAAGGAIVSLHVVPRASKDALAGLHGDALKVRLRAPPVEGRANAALLAFLADAMAVPERHLAVLSGEAGRRKRIGVRGLDAPAVAARLGLTL
jgi:uncharacterized protein (TIGR00251 family)